MVDQKMVDKIKALLNKAESTNHEAEADAFIQKAQELMMKYAVDEAMLRAAGKATKDEIVTHVVNMRKWMADIQGSFLHQLAAIFSCRTYYSELNANRRNHHVVGFESDVVFVEILYLSVAAQAWREALREGHAGRAKVECEDCDGTGYNYLAFAGGKTAEDLSDDEKDLYRCPYCKGKGVRQRSKGTQAKSFLEGYFSRVITRCSERYRKVVESVSTSTALALRDKKSIVDQWVDDNLSLGKGRARRRRAFDAEAYSAGHSAGEKADISGGRGHVSQRNRKELS